jgi:hypothetical protein
MTPKEYEDFVDTFIRTLKHFKHATVYRNKQYVGVRQPGKYEIDIALEMILGVTVRRSTHG